MKRVYENLGSEEGIKRNKIEPISNILNGFLVYILPSRFGPRRLKLFEEQVEKHGGQLYCTLIEDPKNVTHLVVEETVDRETLFKICVVKHFTNAKFLKCSWLTKCFKHNLLIPINDDCMIYENPKFEDCKTNEPLPSTSVDESVKRETLAFKEIAEKNFNPGIIKNEADIEEASKLVITVNDDFKKDIKCNKFIEKFACAHSSSTSPLNLNEHITNELEKLSTAYESRKDTWRVVGYQKAVAAIKNYPKKIETWEEAKSIRGVGERLADKIKEILDSGHLRKVKEVCENEETKVLQLFMGVWGAGPTTANNWYIQGFRTLDDLKMKANLTRHQQIGLKYYDELNERMSRSEVQEIESQVRFATESVKKGLEVTVCGSYRRGKDTCGDVDVLITHPDGLSHENIFKFLLEKLKENGFLTDDLVIQENNGNQQKYLGVCKLPGHARKHRRLDIIVVPYTEYAPAIMYFTGSAHFNRSMRLLATKCGMSLSEHGLRAGIVRDGREKVTGGRLLDTPTEESIFHHLGLPYRSPNERNH